MKTKYTMTTAAAMVLAAFLGSFLAGALLNQDKVTAATKTSGRFMGWRGQVPLADQSRFFILDTATGEVDWYNIQTETTGSLARDFKIDVAAFRFKHGSTTVRKLQ